MHNDDNNAVSEIQERQFAELEFVSAAYSTEEAWIVTEPHNTVHRRFDLSVHLSATHHERLQDIERRQDENADSVSIDLVLTMPTRYPIDPESILRVDASLPASVPSRHSSSSKTSARTTTVRKIVLDLAIPSLLLVCREVATERAEAREEAVFDILTTAASWAEEVWPELASAAHECPTHKSGECKRNLAELSSSTGSSTSKMTMLGRRMIYSHHIIARSKRTALSSLASELNLGGYSKIGWPGLILVEGSEDDCIAFIDTIRRWRWQRLVVRGEERERLLEGEGVDWKRKLPKVWEELGEDGGTSRLAEICKEADLENLFLTSMNIYRDGDKVGASDGGNDGYKKDNNEGASVGYGLSIDAVYGVLLHVDHMNNERSYRKWIQKACKTIGCSVLLKRCRPANGCPLPLSIRKPTILVGLWGEAIAVKQVLKRWRISRVDFDSNGNPCLERMMSVLVEGALEKSLEAIRADIDSVTYKDSHDVKGFDVGVEDVFDSLRAVGGWKDANQSIM